jgi:hypothetical protein
LKAARILGSAPGNSGAAQVTAQVTEKVAGGRDHPTCVTSTKAGHCVIVAVGTFEVTVEGKVYSSA